VVAPADIFPQVEVDDETEETGIDQVVTDVVVVADKVVSQMGAAEEGASVAEEGICPLDDGRRDQVEDNDREEGDAPSPGEDIDRGASAD
jgi:hypothetical protein